MFQKHSAVDWKKVFFGCLLIFVFLTAQTPPPPEDWLQKATTTWQELPVLPVFTERAKVIYRAGLQAGNNSQAFSKVGDCESATTWFLSDFDQPTKPYKLGKYQPLQETITYFAGSFSRRSLAAQNGFSAATILSPLWADPKQCFDTESPLSCEYRLQKPSFALIMLGTNDTQNLGSYEKNLRQLLDQTIAANIVPVLATKADNLEKDQQINILTTKLALEYDLPLWNFWRAVQPLPGHGLQKDLTHLSFGGNNFENPDNLLLGWPMRNLTALQTLAVLQQNGQEIQAAAQ